MWMCVCVGAGECVSGVEGVWGRARDDYQPGSLGSCFLSADVAPVIQLLSDCRGYRLSGWSAGLCCSTATPSCGERMECSREWWEDADPWAAPDAAWGTEDGVKRQRCCVLVTKLSATGFALHLFAIDSFPEEYPAPHSPSESEVHLNAGKGKVIFCQSVWEAEHEIW